MNSASDREIAGAGNSSLFRCFTTLDEVSEAIDWRTEVALSRSWKHDDSDLIESGVLGLEKARWRDAFDWNEEFEPIESGVPGREQIRSRGVFERIEDADPLTTGVEGREGSLERGIPENIDEADRGKTGITARDDKCAEEWDDANPEALAFGWDAAFKHYIQYT